MSAIQPHPPPHSPTHLEDIPHTNGVVIVAHKEDPPTFSKVQGRGTEDNGSLGQDGYLLPCPHVKQTALEVDRGEGRWREGKEGGGRERKGVLVKCAGCEREGCCLLTVPSLLAVPRASAVGKNLT